MGIFLTETPPTASLKHLIRPLFPRNPLFPALRSSPTAVSGPPVKSKFLAVNAQTVGPAGKGAVTHPGAAAETHVYADI